MFGGRAGDDDFLSSVEYFDPDILSWVISDEVELPGGSAFFQHCMLKINDSLAFLTGGNKDGAGDEFVTAETYFLNLVHDTPFFIFSLGPMIGKLLIAGHF